MLDMARKIRARAIERGGARRRLQEAAAELV
jgi:hypothetical protein